MPLVRIPVTAIIIIISYLMPSLAKAQDDMQFSFITGSCAHIDPRLEDSVNGIMYRGDTSIFYKMAFENADFMLWLGDNWYLDKNETTTPAGLNTKARNTLASPILQTLLHRRPNYAIWDDHDYGPDNSNANFPLKNESRNIFMRSWKRNPGFGEKDGGIYSFYRKGDMLLILMDARWWRSSDELWDYKWFRPNKAKVMWGRQQMDWLKRILTANSDARFKIIVNGSQVVNPLAKGDCHIHFPIEHSELMDFLDTSGLKGVLFLTGDRHHGEIIKFNRQGKYPLYDITSSPLTSDIDPVRGREKENPYRVKNTLVEAHHYTHIQFRGAGKERKLVVTYKDNHGRMLANHEIPAAELGW